MDAEIVGIVAIDEVWFTFVGNSVDAEIVGIIAIDAVGFTLADDSVDVEFVDAEFVDAEFDDVEFDDADGAINTDDDGDDAIDEDASTITLFNNNKTVAMVDILLKNIFSSFLLEIKFVYRENNIFILWKEKKRLAARLRIHNNPR